MVIVILRLKAQPEKCLELKQSLSALVGSTRKETGCLLCNSFQDIENDNGFSVIQMWQARRDLDAYMQSDLFNVLVGTGYLLIRPSEITINEVAHSTGWEAVEAVIS